MGFISKKLEKRSTLANPSQYLKDYFAGTFGVTNSSGITVNEQNADSCIAFGACVDRISKALAVLPLDLYMRKPDNGRSKAINHYLYDVLKNNPNPEMTSYLWRLIQVKAYLTHGVCYSKIEYDHENGMIKALWPIPPKNVKPVRDKSGKLYFEVYDDLFQKYTIVESFEMFRVFYNTDDGINPKSPVRTYAESIGLSLATEKFGARFFGNGANLSGVLMHPGSLDAAGESFKHLRDSWEEVYSGINNSHKVVILEEGMKFERIGVPPDESQFLECAVPGTLITMIDGNRKAVESLKENDQIVGYENGLLIPARVKAVGRPPLKKLIKITTVRGRELTVSEDHPCLGVRSLRTPGGRFSKELPNWIPAGELKSGNYISVALGMPENSFTNRMPFDEGYLLGALVGDGYVRKSQSSFTNADIEVIDKVNSILLTYGAELKPEKRPYDYRLKLNSVGCKGSAIRHLLDVNGLTGKTGDSKRVPDGVLTGGLDAMRGFLSGYFDTDGSIRDKEGKQKLALYWSSISKDLLRDCQHMLAMMGIQSSIYKMADAGERNILGSQCNVKTSWGLYVMGNSELQKIANLLELSHVEKKRRLKGYKNLPKSRYRKENFIYDRIKFVEYLGLGETVGIEIEKCHTHVTNGLITHNTRKFQAQEIARIFDIPLDRIQASYDNSSTYANAEHRDLEFQKFCLLPHATNWEQAMVKYLISPQNQKKYYAEFNFDVLLRVDTATRSQFYHQMLEDGVINANEVRARENLQSQGKQGDVYYIPANVIPKGSPSIDEKVGREADGKKGD